MGKFSFDDAGWAHYVYWQEQDRKTLRRINQLLRSIERDGALNGLGKPEKLKHQENAYSRRIDDSNRLIYEVSGDETLVLSCRGHYGDK